MEEEQTTRTKAPHGTFTQIPNVLLDTCDLADETLMLFQRLLRQFGHKGGIFRGSIRQIATITQTKRDKIHRNLRVLEQAKLLSIDKDSMVTLNLADLWELNTAYFKGTEITRWTNLHDILETVREIRQQEVQSSNDASDISDCLSEKSDSLSQKSDKSVRPSVLKQDTKERKTINTKSNTEEENTSSSIDPYWLLWCQSRSPGKKAVITPLSAKNLLHCQNLAVICQEIEQELTVDLILAVEQWSCKEHGYKKYWLGNLVNDLPEYLKEQSTREPEEPALSDEELDRMVLWTRCPHDIDDPVKRWNLYEMMTLREAKQHEWDYWTPVGESGPLDEETRAAIVYAQQLVMVG